MIKNIVKLIHHIRGTTSRLEFDNCLIIYYISFLTKLMKKSSSLGLDYKILTYLSNIY